MQKNKKLLYPTDFSEDTFHTARQAIELCRELNADITFIHVVNFQSVIGVYGVPVGFYADLEKELKKSAETSMKTFLKKLEAPADVQASSIVVDGDTVDQVCETARSLGVDMIVMPTHSRRGLSRWFLGSVTEKVIRSAPCPVMVLQLKGHS